MSSRTRAPSQSISNPSVLLNQSRYPHDAVNFVIGMSFHYYDRACPICGETFRPRQRMALKFQRQPVCDPCGRRYASELQSMIELSDHAVRHASVRHQALTHPSW